VHALASDAEQLALQHASSVQCKQERTHFDSCTAQRARVSALQQQ
jgi:hypothetical protein